MTNRITPGLKRIVRNHIDAKKRKLIVSPPLEKWLTAHGGEFPLNAGEARSLGDMMADHLSRKARNRAGSFSASSVGRCERAQVFGYLGVPQAQSADSLQSMIFIDGKLKHLSFQYMCLQAGILTDIEVPINLPSRRFKGSLDGAHLGEGVGLELKSTRAFHYFITNGPSLSHKLQIHGYFEGRPDIDVFSLVYWDTATREWKEFIVERETQYVRLVNNSLDRMNEAVDHRKMPEVLNECKNGKGETFKGCNYSHVCLDCGSYDEAEAWGSVATSLPSRRRITRPARASRGT